jgi:uncharacterized iron-regulated membrane protein
LRSALPLVRQLHLYLGVFCAPAILFFAFTGALQSFGLNDRSPDGSYVPPQWVSVLAQIHKKQSADLPQRKPASAMSNGPVADKQPQAKQIVQVRVENLPSSPVAHHPIAERIFFLLVCITLVTSTFTGIWMSWKYRRSRVLVVGLFVAGIVIPLVLLKV